MCRACYPFTLKDAELHLTMELFCLKHTVTASKYIKQHSFSIIAYPWISIMIKTNYAINFCIITRSMHTVGWTPHSAGSLRRATVKLNLRKTSLVIYNTCGTKSKISLTKDPRIKGRKVLTTSKKNFCGRRWPKKTNRTFQLCTMEIMEDAEKA